VAQLHRFALVAWIVSWLHGLLAGTDSITLVPLYVGTGLVVMLAGAYRYWVSKKARPTFASSLPDAPRPLRPRPGLDGGSRATPPRPTLVRDTPSRATPADLANALTGASLMEDVQ